MTKSSATAPLLCMLGLAVAITYLAAGVNAQGLSCQTNSQSPTVASARVLVDYIRNLGRQGTNCCQQNCGGDYCTTMGYNSGGRVLICGDCHSCTPCGVAANALDQVLSSCQVNFSGTTRVAGNAKAILDHPSAGNLLTLVIDRNH